MNKEKTWIYSLTDYQIGYLRRLFIDEDTPNAANSKVEKIGFDSNGVLIVDYFKYGQLLTDKITQSDNAESKRKEFNHHLLDPDNHY